MIENKKFDEADIIIDRGTIIVNAKKITYHDSHYNVEVSGPNEHGEYTITCEEPKRTIYVSGYSSNNFDFTKLTEDSYEEYKTLFGKTKLRVKDGWIEYKERTKKTYTTNNIIIIE